MLKSRILLGAIIAVCFFTACKNKSVYDPATQSAIDDGLIKAYLDTNKITDMIKGPQGLYYKVLTPGTDSRTVHLQDSLKIHYVGRLMKNQVLFDSTSTNDSLYATKFLLRDGIVGWQLGIPLIKEGGRIRLIVPSPLAYQNRQVNLLIPANSILDFDIQLISVIDTSQFHHIK